MRTFFAQKNVSARMFIQVPCGSNFAPPHEHRWKLPPSSEISYDHPPRENNNNNNNSNNNNNKLPKYLQSGWETYAHFVC